MTITDSARRLALVAVVAMLAALLPLSGAFAQDDQEVPDGPLAIDLNGNTNVDFALRWSQVTYDTASLETAPPTEALLGRDDVFADSLASGVLQGALENGRPLLLTPSGELNADVLAELQRLDVDLVHVLGQEEAISESVVDELEAAGFDTNRFGGETRIETAIDIAEAIGGDTVIVARAFAGADDATQAFADSLAAGGWAAEDGVPVLLTETDTLTGNTAAHIEEAGYENIIIVGGDMAVSDEVEDALSELGDVTRVSGDDRFETAVAVAQARGYDTPDDAEGVILVDGQLSDAWADGFPAANLSGRGWPIVLSNSATDGLPQATVDYLEGESESFLNHLDNVVLICGSSVPDGQCQQAADILGATVIDFVPPGTEEPVFVARQCDGPLDTYTAGPELVGLEIDSNTGDQTAVVTYTFDQTIPGQALDSSNAQGEFRDFRLYPAVGQTVAYPTEARIAGDSVITRFPSAAVAESASRAGVSFNAITNDIGLPNSMSHCALSPTTLTAQQGGFLQLIGVGNYRLGDTIIGLTQDVFVDFTFNANPNSFYGDVEAEDFWLVGNNSALFQGQEIEDGPRQTSANGPWVVTVKVADDPALVPRAQVRRGIFNYTGDDLNAFAGSWLAEPFEGTSGATTDPDLDSASRLNATQFDFVFDEAVSQVEINSTAFYVFDSEGTTTQAESAARVAGGGATTVRATFPALPTASGNVETPVGAYVDFNAVRATDNTQSESLGFNRPDQVELSIDVAGDTVVPAGVTERPDLIELLVDENVVTENFSVSFVFDQAFDSVADVRFSLFDEDGIEFSEDGVECFDPGVDCDFDATTGQFTVVFSVDDGFSGGGISNEAIAAAVSGGVETFESDVEAFPIVVTEGYFGVNEDVDG